MSLLNMCFRSITCKLRYSKNGLDNLDMSKTVKEVIDTTLKYADAGNGCSSLQAAICLSRKLYTCFTPSEIILTRDITNNMRVSVLTHDGFKWVVMNPIEDIEFFEDKKIPPEIRDKFYNVAGEFRGAKQGIVTKDASTIPLADFIERYGNGQVWSIGYICAKKNADLIFKDVYANARIININDYQDKNGKLK